ncbi:hypothetical protein MTR67_002379 [Solanum verrucosum]|uniref:DUF1985 domain-containing protein n=1 Tax=Solanum verrucosum TaxID=315347 RepID=A0AAF0T8Q2_SOLVR|nr:hypothetical protein MTR67_002379 [Solanum verrucosum]
MKQCHVQAQLFRCFVLWGLEDNSTNAIIIYVNSTKLPFTIISCLNCSDNESEFFFDINQPNRIMVEYFPGQSYITKAQLIASYRAKVWGDNEYDAYKFWILYYIHTFLMSAEPNRTSINRIEFDFVESGRYMDYPWGKKAFDELVKIINNKIKPKEQYYMIHASNLKE